MAAPIQPRALLHAANSHLTYRPPQERNHRARLARRPPTTRPRHLRELRSLRRRRFLLCNPPSGAVVARRAT
ncbi:hypothetical protein HYPSUDRAFT_919592 [Hypholoma sublateritium FD-334 SS-4]|uniref:Uncharacterized protein n=1 Tax=Hypholoma sublateritium (strain FD-334 SS-4) TaxID=945553 RepID=A0A0D2NIC0_HYPSF|nr:hypothetical protein HYPSUDRAFT_919592 [Hypholoma sublateritium FD-334 SS-4]